MDAPVIRVSRRYSRSSRSVVRYALASVYWRANNLPDVYKAADKHNVTVFGGTARSMEAAGVLGKGYCPFSGMYSLGVNSKPNNGLP